MIWDRKTAPQEAVLGIPLPEGGYRLKPFDDGFGNWTIGAGSLHMPDGSRVTRGSRAITLAEAHALFARDLAPCTEALAVAIPQELTTGQAACLISLLYNCGSGQLSNSVIQRQAAAGRLDLVRGQLPGWCEAKNRISHIEEPELGLMRRRLFDQMLFDGEPPTQATCDKAWQLQLPAGLAAFHQAIADAATWGWSPTPAPAPHPAPAATPSPTTLPMQAKRPAIAHPSRPAADDDAGTDALNDASAAGTLSIT